MTIFCFFIDMVLVRLMTLGVNVEWKVIDAEHVMVFFSHESPCLFCVRPLKSHVEPSVSSSLLTLSMALPPKGSEHAKTKFLVGIQLKFFRPIHAGHFVNELVQGLDEPPHVADC